MFSQFTMQVVADANTKASSQEEIEAQQHSSSPPPPQQTQPQQQALSPLPQQLQPQQQPQQAAPLPSQQHQQQQQHTPPLPQQQQQQQDDLALLNHPFLKDGKLFYQEQNLRPESHPYVAQGILAFRTRRQQMEAAIFHKQQGVHEIQSNEDDATLIALLVQDSDETLPVLTSRLNELLSPFDRFEQVNDVYLGLIEQNIRSVANRQPYGLDISALNQTDNTTTSVPPHLVTYRWEVPDTTKFPMDYLALLNSRRLARQQMSALITQHYWQLPPHLQHYLLFTKHRKGNTSLELKAKYAEEMAQEAERRAKNEEKQRKKEEERQKKEEERQKKDEERQKKEEEQRKRNEDKKKKEQSQLRLTSLFAKNADGKGSSVMETDHILESKSMFPPFFVKDHVNMYTVKPIQGPKSDLTSILTSYSTHSDHHPSEDDHLQQRYLQELTTKRPELTYPRRIKRQVDLKQLLLPTSAGSNLDSIHRPENKCLLKMKLLQFTEDVRPAYYGTWTKSSNHISPTNPFAKDVDLIDYDYDSEAEWEPEGEGEDIQSGDEEEEDMAPEATDPEDIGWLVPEGYLSEGEGVNDSEDDGMTKIVQRLSVRPKSRKNIVARPIVVGPIYENDDDMEYNEPLSSFGVRMLIDTTGYDPFAICEKKTTTVNHGKSNTGGGTNMLASDNTNNKASIFNQEHTAALTNIIHNATDNMNQLLTKVKADPVLCNFSKAKLEAKIKDIAIKEKRGLDTKSTWYVKEKIEGSTPPLQL